MRKTPFLLSTVVMSVLSSSVLPACGPSASSICDQICECEGCSRTEAEDCVDGLEDLARDAENDSCDEQHDLWVACVADDLRCRDDRAEADGCEREAEDLAKCLDGGAVATRLGTFGDPCQQFAEQARACGYAVDEDVVCEPQNERCVRCVLDETIDFCNQEDFLRAAQVCQTSGDC